MLIKTTGKIGWPWHSVEGERKEKREHTALASVFT